MIRDLVLRWLFPSCDIDADVDRENIWNVLNKISRRQKSCANFSRGSKSEDIPFDVERMERGEF